MSTILVVEDDHILAETVVDSLELDAHAAEFVMTGADAMKRLGGAAFDLVLLDWQLPDTDGIEVLKEIRAREMPSRVIMLTGLSDSASLAAALDAGADDVLRKPFTVRELRDRIRLVLGPA